MKFPQTQYVQQQIPNTPIPESGTKFISTPIQTTQINKIPTTNSAQDTNHIIIPAANPDQTEITALYPMIPKQKTSESSVEMQFSDREELYPNEGKLCDARLNPKCKLRHAKSGKQPLRRAERVLSYADGLDIVALKHRWRWKHGEEEEDATRARRGGRHCYCRSRAGQGTGGPRSRAMGRRLGPVPMLFSVGSRSCKERRRVVRVDDEGQFRAVHFRPKQTDRWHPHELFPTMKFHFKAEGHAVMREDGYLFASRRLWILQWAGSCAWTTCMGTSTVYP